MVRAWRPRRLGQLLVCATVVIAGLLAMAAPAAAHSVGGVRPTNRKVTVTSTPAGVHVRLIDLGARIDLAPIGCREVTVRGIYNEPYLRVGPSGASYNARSPTYYADQPRRAGPPLSPPPDAGITGPPRWTRIHGTGCAITWADKRVAALGGWTIPVEVRGADGVIAGTTRVVAPSGSGWRWAGLTVAIAIGVVAAGWRHPRVIILAATSTLLLALAAHAVGAAMSSPASSTVVVGRVLLDRGGVVVALGVLTAAAAIAVARRHDDVVLMGALAGLIAFFAGTGDATTLSRSQLPTTLPPTLDRVAVTAVIAFGAAVAVTATRGVRRGSAPGVTTLNRFAQLTDGCSDDEVDMLLDFEDLSQLANELVQVLTASARTPVRLKLTIVHQAPGGETSATAVAGTGARAALRLPARSALRVAAGETSLSREVTGAGASWSGNPKALAGIGGPVKAET